MGRIKTKLIKRKTLGLLEKYREYFSEDFEHNKVQVARLTDVKSKKLKNAIAGFVTRLKKREEVL